MPVSLAAIAAVLERIEKRDEEDRKALADDRAKSELARSAVSAELTDIRHGQENVVKRLNKIEPVTDMVTSFRAMVFGGMVLAGIIGAAVWAVIKFFREAITGWLQ